MSWHSQPRERKRERSGESPGRKGKGKRKGDPAIAGQSVATKRKESGASRGQKATNQRYNRRFFGVLPEPRSTGETTRTKTDGSLSSEISDSGNERKKQKGNRGSHPMGNKQTKEKKRGGAISLGVQREWCVVTLGGNAGVER